MSSYNGEKYIEQQIDSILEQTYENIVIYVRDDGSSDGTVDILSRYQEQGKIVVIRGKNIGYIRSFFQMLTECEKTDYYAWCDQDDVWVPDKIERAVSLLEEDRKIYQTQEEKPVLYFAGYDYYNENMQFQKHGLVYRRGPSFANSLMDCISLGFNSVFNHRTREYMEENQPQKCCGHDWWTYMICAAFGRVIYDSEFCAVKYRRLENSVSPGGKNFISLQIWRFKKFFLNDYFSNIRSQLREFSNLYLEKLKKKDAGIMKLFSNEKYSFVYALKKTFYPVWFRQGILEEIMVRILFLTGKL